MTWTPADLDDLVRDVAAELGVVGAQVAVLQGDEVVAGTHGVTDARTAQPVTDDTVFQIGSTTKVHTAALVLQLVEQGLVGLDVPVVEQLPGFVLSDPLATATVTPRHLMSMSSGIDNGPYDDHGRGDDAVARYVAALADLPHLFAPGSGYGYTNASTVVSGRLVEHVTGQTWDDALRTRLLEPAGLHETVTLPEDVLPLRHALGHDLDGTPMTRWGLPRSLGPAGSTCCASAADLVRLARVFLRGGRSLQGEQVLRAETTALLQQPQVDVPATLLADWWGLGPYGRQWQGGLVLGHSGTSYGGSSYLLWAPDHDVAAATTVNVPGLGYPLAHRVHAEVLRSAAGLQPQTRPAHDPGVTVDTDRLVGRYAMSGVIFDVAAGPTGLTVAVDGTLGSCEASPLLPLTPTTFLPTDPAVDGRRGWAVAFLGPDDAPATHLLNGFFALRRVAA